MNKSLKILILAGGSGTRLFPLSRENYPKQFLAIGGETTLFQQTVLRALKVVGSLENISFVANREYEYQILNQVASIGFPVELVRSNLILEPYRKNTAPSIALAIKRLLEVQKLSEDEPILVLPCDQVITPEERFLEHLRAGEPFARDGWIVTFGVIPRRAEEGYGYIEVDSKNPLPRGGALRVMRFHEKPDPATAQQYLSQGNYYWNSGIFAFTARTFLEELKLYTPEIYNFLEGGSYEDVLQRFGEMPEISLDYAIMEKTKKAVVIPIKDVFWSDVGSWESVYEILDRDNDQNVRIGDVVALDTKGSLLMADHRVIATIGIEGLIVVETPDLILVTKRGVSQRIRELFETLRRDPKRRETIAHQTTVYRPWGYYIELERGDRYRIKRIRVNPGESLSLQLHYHRSEHWVVVKGTAMVILEDEKGDCREVFVHENESIFIPKTTKHRLANPGKIPLELIEVQVGEYIEEDDIVRFQDRYERVPVEGKEEKG
jgi:mannose-1-phosphate guanylyltransferase/mannose-6-phosphate isomerase